ncbi:MAG: AAA family ATPase [Bacteroidetes bacterium]|nr:AAA family ATPase [Bacteroidota bacterium]
MNPTFIGRKKELEILHQALESSEPEMVSVIGRRRVGKTFLVKSAYEGHIDFELTGIRDISNAEQLQNFSFHLTKQSNAIVPVKVPKNWLEAFFMLTNFLEKKKTSNRKQIVFFDELPWMASPKSGFLSGLSYFWNSWAVNQNIVVVICGSAASWMIQKVVKNTGGLHNRITKRIIVNPFTLSETEQYLHQRGIKLNRYHIVQLYMAMGGIPHYLKEIKPGKSVVQNIDQICFSDTGLLRDEFLDLYPALFENPDKHIAVIRALSTKRQGMDREEIIKSSKLANGGSLTRTLEELNQSGFISTYQPFGKKKKNTLYRLTDEYSFFYLKFIEKKRNEGVETWQHLSQTQEYKIWSGYAYEGICIKHLHQIKKALSIGGVYSVSSSFLKKGTKTEKGVQIDLLLDRNDHIINLFEIKFYNKPFTISKAYAKELKEKMDLFEETTKTRKHLFLTLITTFGLIPNEYSLGLIDQVLTLDDLFI